MMLSSSLEGKNTPASTLLQPTRLDTLEIAADLKEQQNLLAWKEHHLRLRKNAVHVRNLPTGATKETLLQYFKKFGEISTIEMGYRDTRTSTGTARYCLVVGKDDQTYQAILKVSKHRFKGKDIFCTPCVKGSRSLASLNQMINSRKLVLRQKLPATICFDFGQFQQIVSRFGYAVDAHYIRANPVKHHKLVAITFDEIQDTKKLSQLKTLSGYLEAILYKFEIEPNNLAVREEIDQCNQKHTSGSQQGGNKQIRSEGSSYIEYGGDKQNPKSVFPPYHRYLPCRYNYYTKRLRFGGRGLEHEEQNLRFNRTQNLTTEQLEHRRSSITDVGKQEHLREIQGYDNLQFEDSGWSSERTLTPTKQVVMMDWWTDPEWYAKPIPICPLIQ